MQSKIDKLSDILKTIKNKRQSNFGLLILSELVNVINNQEKEIYGLMAWKTNNNKGDLESELQKYILLLIINGYSQKFINSIRTETLIFIAKNKNNFKNIEATDIKKIDLILMNYQFEFDNLPNDYKVFKKYLDESES